MFLFIVLHCWAVSVGRWGVHQSASIRDATVGNFLLLCLYDIFEALINCLDDSAQVLWASFCFRLWQFTLRLTCKCAHFFNSHVTSDSEWVTVSSFSSMVCVFNIHRSGVLTVLFRCCMAGAMWNCCHLSTSYWQSNVCTLYNHAPVTNATSYVGCLCI